MKEKNRKPPTTQSYDRPKPNASRHRERLLPGKKIPPEEHKNIVDVVRTEYGTHMLFDVERLRQYLGMEGGDA